jgi:hypothetical protein
MLTIRETRRSLGNWLAIMKNRLRQRTYAPHPRRAIFVETSARCNLACRFCAYEQIGPGALMGNDFFDSTIRQIVATGFDFVYLTPMLGEAFADPTLFDKFNLLERERGITGYSFYTNFILPRTAQIHALSRLTKLRALYISLYGFDESSFELTTRKPAKQFQRLYANLHTLLGVMASLKLADGIHFSIRTVRNAKPFMESQTPFVALLRRFQKECNAHIDEADDYDTWAGMITNDDVTPLGIELTDGRQVYMYGACTKIFGELQIKADGAVHACACRDTDGSLYIGHLGSQSLADILSWDNPSYRQLILDQMKGKFGSNCRLCSSYRSVFDDRPSRFNPDLRVMDVEDAIALLSSGAERQHVAQTNMACAPIVHEK